MPPACLRVSLEFWLRPRQRGCQAKKLGSTTRVGGGFIDHRDHHKKTQQYTSHNFCFWCISVLWLSLWLIVLILFKILIQNYYK